MVRRHLRVHWAHVGGLGRRGFFLLARVGVHFVVHVLVPRWLRRARHPFIVRRWNRRLARGRAVMVVRLSRGCRRRRVGRSRGDHVERSRRSARDGFWSARVRRIVRCQWALGQSSRACRQPSGSGKRKDGAQHENKPPAEAKKRERARARATAPPSPVQGGAEQGGSEGQVQRRRWWGLLPRPHVDPTAAIRIRLRRRRRDPGDEDLLGWIWSRGLEQGGYGGAVRPSQLAAALVFYCWTVRDLLLNMRASAGVHDLARVAAHEHRAAMGKRLGRDRDRDQKAECAR